MAPGQRRDLQQARAKAVRRWCGLTSASIAPSAWPKPSFSMAQVLPRSQRHLTPAFDPDQGSSSEQQNEEAFMARRFGAALLAAGALIIASAIGATSHGVAQDRSGT